MGGKHKSFPPFLFNKKEAMKKIALLFTLILCAGALNSMEQPIYEILARKQAEEWGADAEGVNSLIKYYKNYENYLENNQKKEALKNMPILMIGGGLNYMMTLEEMKQKIKEKFSAMKKNGLIISKADFGKIKNKYFVPTGNNDLSRLWGAEYLKNRISTSPNLSKKYDVPGYIIVVDNPKLISVKIGLEHRFFPLVSLLENGMIYFEKIAGERVAGAITSNADIDIGKVSGIGYADFSDKGNIILNSENHKEYIVDTEIKSFDFDRIITESKVGVVLDYLALKFRYLNNITSGPMDYTFTLP